MPIKAPKSKNEQSAVLTQLLLGSLVRGASAEVLDWASPRLTQHMRELRPRSGEVIYRQGEHGASFYVLAEGRLRLETGSASRSLCGPRETLGWLDATLRRPRTHTAIAESNVTLLEVPVEDLRAVAEDSLELSMALIADAARRLVEIRNRHRPHRGETSGKPIFDPVCGGSDVTRALAVLRRVNCFANARMQSLVSLSEHARAVTVGAGDSFDAGNGALWVVSRGETTCHDRVAGPGGLVSDVETFLFERDEPRPCRALVNVNLIRIDLEDWINVAEEHFDIVQSTLIWIGCEQELLQFYA